MTVDGQRVDLEIQVRDEGDYPQRSLYYWAREYSTALVEGGDYLSLPRTIVISIVDFPLFDCENYRSEFQLLEVSRHTPLTDLMILLYFELSKLPAAVSRNDEQMLWLKLFKANTEEELKQLESLEAPVMKQAISAYRSVIATDEFKEIERLRSRARHNEAAALRHARNEAEKEEREKWQGVVAENEATIAEKDALIAELMARLGEGN